VQQVNIGGPDNALESLRRLAFAIERVARERERLVEGPNHAAIAGATGSTLEGSAEPGKSPPE
jgi:hypothetical protein